MLTSYLGVPIQHVESCFVFGFGTFGVCFEVIFIMINTQNNITIFSYSKN